MCSSTMKGREKILDCFICSISFKQQHLLDDHVRRHHTREEPFVCRTCDKSFSTQGSVSSHKRLTHGNSRFACSKCSATYKRKDYLKEHVRLNHEKKNRGSLVKCLDPDCDKVFLYPSSMKSHHEVYHQEMTSRFKYRCTECDARFMQQPGLRKHMNTHHNSERPASQCEFCKKIFESEELLRQHKIQEGHDKAKRYNCGYCQLAFSEPASLQRHRKRPTHLQTVEEYDKAMRLDDFHVALAEKGFELDDVFPCGSCESSYNTEEELAGHEETLHNTNLAMPHCEEDGCGKVFERKDSLVRHLKTVHKRIANFGSKKCGLKSKTKEKLISHKCGRGQLKVKRHIPRKESKSSSYKPTRSSTRVKNRMNKSDE